MRGTDVTEEQMKSAREFAFARSVGLEEMPDDQRIIMLPFGKMVRLMAWYGAMRYKAGRDGAGGTLESPGEFVATKNKKTSIDLPA